MIDKRPATGAHAKPTRADLEGRIAALEAEVAQLRATDASHGAHLEAIVNAAPVALFFKDAAHRYLFANATLKRLAGRSGERFRGRDDFELWPEPIAALFRAQDLEVMRRGEQIEFRETIPLADGVLSFITLKFPLFGPDGALLGVGGVCTDLTRDVEAAAERERLLAELQMATRQIATLEGILPICSFCKRIRDERGAWEAVEVYVKDRTRADFSHSVCPGCMNKHYPGVMIDEDPRAGD